MLLRAMILLFLWANLTQRNIHQRWEDLLDRHGSSRGMINNSDLKKEFQASGS